MRPRYRLQRNESNKVNYTISRLNNLWALLDFKFRPLTVVCYEAKYLLWKFIHALTDRRIGYIFLFLHSIGCLDSRAYGSVRVGFSTSRVTALQEYGVIE